jgi:hypothetical protein
MMVRRIDLVRTHAALHACCAYKPKLKAKLVVWLSCLIMGKVTKAIHCQWQ